MNGATTPHRVRPDWNLLASIATTARVLAEAAEHLKATAARKPRKAGSR